ncbi:hypothetical protein L195_g031921 [Trifolium pratense]|uniref:Uncharacterized protein n=1 Tax=Trifolium pratense TaxID=57577 RepID=A0A2K3LBR4_TRIPR|nr:hypothetical protein L195_g031921 [Trifolium pratense]
MHCSRMKTLNLDVKPNKQGLVRTGHVELARVAHKVELVVEMSWANDGACGRAEVELVDELSWADHGACGHRRIHRPARLGTCSSFAKNFFVSVERKRK